MGAIIHHLLDAAPDPVAPVDQRGRGRRLGVQPMARFRYPENEDGCSGLHRGADQARDGQPEDRPLRDRIGIGACRLRARLRHRHARVRDHEQDSDAAPPTFSVDKRLVRTWIGVTGLAKGARVEIYCAPAVANRYESGCIGRRTVGVDRMQLVAEKPIRRNPPRQAQLHRRYRGAAGPLCRLARDGAQGRPSAIPATT